MKPELAKPIVPGCMCIILPTHGGMFVGRFCTAITKMPAKSVDMNGVDVSGNWLTDLPPLHGVRRWVVRESYLMRIDDPGNQLEIASEKPVEKKDDVSVS